MPSPRPLYLTNSYGRRSEEFKPLDPAQIKMYACGPTVYSYQHLGNFRAFIFADVLRRVLEYNGFTVHHVRNVTDVGHLTNDTLNTGLDKIESAARARNTTPLDIARYFTGIFLRDADRLNLLPPTHQPKATDYIEPMIVLTERLIQEGYGYVVDGSVYYDVGKFPRYGGLSGNAVEDLIAGARVEAGEGKRSPADFALWKATGPDKIMKWNSPWGQGVPGWHMECSAMAFSLLGEEIDIHTGGVDNIFPHHEDEIAQSEAASGRTFARYWLHSAWLNLPGDEKMSKSTGNFLTLDDIAGEGIHPLAYRYFTFQAHYRTPLTFSRDALAAAQTALERLWEASAELYQSADEDVALPDERFRSRFHDAINRDLDLPTGVAILHETLGSNLPAGDKLRLLADFDAVLALDLVGMGKKLSERTENHHSLMEERQTARDRKDWKKADELRGRLQVLGLDVKDTAQGQRWIRRDLLSSGTGEPQNSTNQHAENTAGNRAQ